MGSFGATTAQTVAAPASTGMSEHTGRATGYGTAPPQERQELLWSFFAAHRPEPFAFPAGHDDDESFRRTAALRFRFHKSLFVLVLDLN